MTVSLNIPGTVVCSSVDVHVVCLVCNNTNTVTQLANWPSMAGF